jgi:hypothetical protein
MAAPPLRGHRASAYRQITAGAARPSGSAAGPGVYFDGEWGARVEDIVVVTEDGYERLNDRPRDLVVL